MTCRGHGRALLSLSAPEAAWRSPPPCPRILRDRTWLTDKTQVLYFSSRFLILKNKTRLAALFILLL